jgi:hypothetical protein
MGKSSITLSPIQAATAADASYKLQKNNVPIDDVFSDLKNEFDFSGPKGLQGKSGATFYQVKTGFAAVGKGRGLFADNGLIVVRGTDSTSDWISDAHGGTAQSSISKQIVHSGFKV